MMKTWLLGTFSLLSTALVVSACVLVEDFQGYEPLTCDNPPCPDASSSGNGGSGTGGGGTGGSSSGGSGGSGPTCPMIPCTGDPCAPVEVVADSQMGIMTTDAQSFFILNAQSTGVVRVGKLGCLVPHFDQPLQFPSLDQSMVSDGNYAVWITTDFSGGCISPALRFCDPKNCKPQDVTAAATFPDQGEFLRVALGPDHVYFTMRNGLAGRLPKGSTQPEMLWIDPEAMGTKVAFLVSPLLADGKFFASRPWLADYMSVCSSLVTAGTGAIWSSDATPNATPTKISNTSYYGSLVADQNYLYISHNKDGSSLLDRMPKAGGSIEPLIPSANIKTSSDAQGLTVKNGWVYFRAITASGSVLIVRMPANSPTWSVDAAEVVVERPYLRAFVLDDVAIYWEECVDVVNCTTYRIMALPLKP